MVTVKPRWRSSNPMEDEAIPFPNEESTPPVMKMYFDVFGTQHLRIIREVMDGLKSTHS